MARSTKKSPIIDTLAMIGGGVGAGFLSNLIPVGDDKMKAGALLVGGYFLSSKPGIIGAIAKGLMVGAGAQLVQSFTGGGVNGLYGNGGMIGCSPINGMVTPPAAQYEVIEANY